MTTATGQHDPCSLMAGLVLDDGRTWADAALDWQRSDARAVLSTDDPEAPRRHYILRGRGMSKTSDVAAMVLIPDDLGRSSPIAVVCVRGGR